MTEAVKGSHAIVVMTEWDEFATADYKAMFDVMAKPAFVFDGRNILPHGELREIGFEVYVIVRGLIIFIFNGLLLYTVVVIFHI